MNTPLFFSSRAAFFTYLSTINDKDDLWVGFHKVHTGIPSLRYGELVDVCLCLGWIDGKRMRIDADKWMIRITPRRKGSIWSQVNLSRYRKLESAGMVLDVGKEAYAVRKEEEHTRESILNGDINLSAVYLDEIKRNKVAWVFYQSLTDSVQKTYVLWIMSAKKEITQRRRLAKLIEFAEQGKLVPALQR